MAEALKDEFNRLNKRIADLYAKQDFKSIGDMHTEDCVVMAPGKEVRNGRAGAIKNVEEDYNRGDTSFTYDTLEIVTSGDNIATERGSYVIYNAAGKAINSGNAVLLRKKVNGQWLIHFDIANSTKA